MHRPNFSHIQLFAEVIIPHCLAYLQKREFRKSFRSDSFRSHSFRDANKMHIQMQSIMYIIIANAIYFASSERDDPKLQLGCERTEIFSCILTVCLNCQKSVCCFPGHKMKILIIQHEAVNSKRVSVCERKYIIAHRVCTAGQRTLGFKIFY